MIHLDTNVLIALPLLARQAHPLAQRIGKGEAVAVSALVWFEYVCGPAREQEQQLARAVISGQIVPVDEAIAERAAVLFNAAGRKRSLRTDSLVAATALLADAELASFNARDFQPFRSHGMRLLRLEA